MEKKQNTGNKYLFYSLAVGAAVAMVGSAYYLYNLFTQEEELSEEDMVKIEELKEEITQQIINILQLDKDNSFILYDFDRDPVKQEKILALSSNIKKYFASRYQILKYVFNKR